MDNRRMCPNCRAFITTADKVCPYCDQPVGPRATDVRDPSPIAGIPANRFTTVVLLLVNAGMFVACVLFAQQTGLGGGFGDVHGRVLELFGAKSRPLIAAGQWWRLITAGFLHGGMLHILMNSWVIFDLGAAVEEAYGTARYLVIYILATIGGFYASLMWTPAISVGASAALYGLIGAMIALGVRKRNTREGAIIRSHYTQWALWGMITFFLPGLRVDNAAHVGGLLTGFVVAWVTGTPKLTKGAVEGVWKTAAAICVAVTIASFALMLLFVRAVLAGSK